MLSVSKTSVPFNYQLTVSRVYEEGDANILDEEDDDAGAKMIRSATSFLSLSLSLSISTC